MRAVIIMKKFFPRTTVYVLCLLITMLSATPAYGLTAEQRRVIDSGARYFNVEESAAPVACIPGVPLSGSDNPEKVWNFFISKGLTATQAAGFMGNMQAEAHFEPRLVEYGWLNSRGERSVPGKPSSLDDNVPPDQNSEGQPGYGIVQWTSPNRKQGLRDMAASRNMIAGDLGLQLDYLWLELTTAYKGVYDELVATTTLEDSTRLILYKYENPDNKEKEMPKRLRFATDFLTRFGSGGTGAVPTANANCPQQLSGVCSATTSLPLAADTQIAWFNRTNHGTSVSYPQRTNGHNTILHKNNHFGAETVMNASISMGEAVDIGAAAGTKVFSPTDGKVLRASTIHRDGSDGYMVIIESANKKCVSVMAHLTQPLVADGSTVTAGQELGRLTGSIANPHLHFELWVDGQPINIGLDPDPCSTGQQGCDSYSDEAEQIWNKQKEALTGGGSNG